MSDTLSLEKRDDVLIVSLAMRQIDMFNVTELLEEVKPALEERPRVVIFDLAKTDFIDSSGMGGLIRIHQQIKANDGRLLITGLNPKVANLMRLTRSTQYLSVYDSLDEALAAASS